MGLLLNDVMFPVKDVSERCRFTRIPLHVVSLLKDTPERSFITKVVAFSLSVIRSDVLFLVNDAPQKRVISLTPAGFESCFW